MRRPSRPVSALALASLATAPLPTARLAAQDNGDAVVTVALEADGKTLPKAGAPTSLTITARDPGTGYPLTGLNPAVWLVPADKATNSCETWVNRLAGTPSAPPGVLDLNGYDILQLATDGSLALIDPQLNLATANIRAVVRLGAIPALWSIDPAGAVLALVRDDDRKTVRLFGFGPLEERHTIPVSANVVALSAGEADILAGTDDGRVLRISPDGTVLDDMAIGTGAVAIHQGEDGVLFALSADGSGLLRGADDHTVRFGGAVVGARSIAFAPLADAGYILSRDGMSIATLFRDNPDRMLTQPLARAASRLVPDLRGRWIALPAVDGTGVDIFDTRIGRIRWTVATDDLVRDVIFSDSFLYLTHTKAGGVTRVVFDPEGGEPGIAMIAAGSAADQPRAPSTFPLMIRVPGNGIIAASRDQRVGYMVAEDGAQAAMSSIPLLGGDSAGLLLRYRGARATARAGEYRVQFVPEHGGEYVAVVRLDQPAIAHCRTVSFAGPPDPLRLALDSGESAAALPSLKLVSGPSDANGEMRFALTGVAKDVQIRNALLMAESGTWRAYVQPTRAGNGQFTLATAVPSSGRYRLFVEVQEPGAAPRTLGLAVAFP